MLRYVIACFAIVLLFCSCGREELDTYDNNFTGTWRNRDTLYSADQPTRKVNCYMEVNDGTGKIEMLCDEHGTCWQMGTGAMLINKQRNEIITNSPQGGRKRSFKIIRFPYRDASGKWLCNIENVTMVKD